MNEPYDIDVRRCFILYRLDIILNSSNFLHELKFEPLIDTMNNKPVNVNFKNSL